MQTHMQFLCDDCRTGTRREQGKALQPSTLSMYIHKHLYGFTYRRRHKHTCKHPERNKKEKHNRVVSSPSSCPRSGFAHDPRVAPSRPPTQPERLWCGAPPRSRSLDPPQLRKALSCSRSASAHRAPSPSRDSPQHTLTTSRSRSASLSPSPAPFSPPVPPSSTRRKLLEGSVFPPNR